MKPARFVLRSIVLFALTGAAPLLAQDDERRFTVNFRGNPIEEVTQIVAEATGRTIIPDSRLRGQPVDLFNRREMTADELWALYLQILQSNQYAAIESGGIWRIVPEAQARSEASRVGGGSGAEMVTRTIIVENVPPAQLVPALRPMMSTQAANFSGVPGTNMLLLVDRADNVDRIVQIIQMLDRANSQQVEVLPLQFASAEDVTQKLTQLIQAQSGQGLVGASVIPNERTNSILLAGTPDQIARNREIVEKLDLPSSQGGNSTVRYLYYANAEDIATSLQSQFGGTQVADDAETAADPTGGDVSIWADIGTNSVVMRAPSVVQQDMHAIIDQLDIPRAQVHIQAIIVEMSANRAAELGLTWIIDGAGGDQAALLTNFSAITGGILDLAQIGSSDTPDTGLIRDGLTAAVGDLDDNGTSWAAVVSALNGDGETNVMQMPELVVLDNEEATIEVGQEVPFVTGQYTNQGQGGPGGVNPFQTTQREPVGTLLTITPRINEGTGMRLQISQEISSISASNVASDVITNRRAIETSVFVNDGDILVLGGLMDDQLRENEESIPGLGKIPGFKWLFSARSSQRTKTSLMVFIRPTILRDSAAANMVTNEKYRLLRDEQLRRSEEPIPLMKDVERPALPELDESPALPPQSAPPSVDELLQSSSEPTLPTTG